MKKFSRFLAVVICVVSIFSFNAYANNHTDTVWAAVWETMLIKDWKYSKSRMKEDSTPVYTKVTFMSPGLRGRRLYCSVVDSNFNSVFNPRKILLAEGGSGAIYSDARGGDLVSHAVRLQYFVKSDKQNARGVWSPDSVGY